LKDLVLVGNDYAVRAQQGRYDAGKGAFIAQHTKDIFSVQTDTGLLAEKDARRIIRIDNFLILANNNDKIQVFRIN
jgi:hypothetical protein